MKFPVVNGLFTAPDAIWARRDRARANVLLALFNGTLTALLLGARPASAAIDYLELPLESLLQIQIPRVSGASGYEQSASQVPSAVTVIGAEDIRRYGYRTLGEALSSERGFYYTDSGNYQFLGLRGFHQPGDYNSRFLLLIDGMRINDPVYGMAPIGEDFPLDLSLVDRVEIIRGPGSSLYGSGSLLGVINVVTKRGESIAGTRLHGSAGSLGAGGFGVSHGMRTEGGTDIVGSFTGFRQDGLDPLLYPEFGQDPASNFGVVAGASHEQARRLHLAVTHGDVRFSVVDGTRRNRYGNGLYGTVFGDPRGHTFDARQFVDLQYQRSMDSGRAVTARVYRGHYRYRADYPVDYAPVAINRDDVTSTWWGTELRYDHRLGAHQVTVGGEWIATTHNQLRNFDQDTGGAYAGCIGAGLADSCVDRRLPGGTAAMFVRDDVTLSPHWRATATLRQDWVRGVDSVATPRVGLIYTPHEGTSIKVLHGHSFRAPAIYERYSAYAGYGKDSLELRSERARTFELIAEHSFLPNLRALASLFRYTVDGLAVTATDPVDGLAYNANTSGVHARGAEIEVQWRIDWVDLRGSYARFDSHIAGTSQRPASSPRDLAKLRAGVPMRDEQLYAGIEAQYAAGALDIHGHAMPRNVLVNLVTTSRGVVPRLDVSFGIYNLFDRAYRDPTSYADLVGSEGTPRPGRTFRVRLEYWL